MKPIKIKVLNLNDSDRTPWNMTIANANEVVAYMVKDDQLMFNFQGSIYKASEITEKEFLKLFPHLITEKVR
jgi:hypothetical protein